MRPLGSMIAWCLHRKEVCVKAQAFHLNVTVLSHLERKKVEISLNRILFEKQSLEYESRHVSVMTTASCNKRLNLIIIGRFQGTLLSPSNQWDLFLFWRNGEFTFYKDVYRPSIFPGPHSLPSGRVQFFRYSIRAFNDRIQTDVNSQAIEW